jgi:Fic family protein
LFPGSRLICDPAAKADLVLENVLRQFDRVVTLAQDAFKRDGAPLTPEVLCELHRLAVDRVYSCAGTFRDHGVRVGNHVPPDWELVPGHTANMCDYVRERWDEHDAVTLSAYVMWRVNWIHPFGGGNGRTSRAASYLVLLARHGSLLPGAPIIPQRLVEGHRAEYVEALRDADAALATTSVVDVTLMAELLAKLVVEQIRESGA